MEKTIKMELECDGMDEVLEKAKLLKDTLSEAKQLADSLRHSNNYAEEEILRQQLKLLAERSKNACTDQGLAEISKNMVLIYQTLTQEY